MEASRTFIGSVVCLDLVGYSRRSVAQQSAVKEVFNQLLVQVLKRVPAEDRIILDTGDGAAISFLGDPEESLAIGLMLRDAMNAAAVKLGCVPPDQGPVRIGINLGPVKLGVDMNGHPKIIGDGINVAEKICEFANPGQIVVSRPFHDMVSRISARHKAIFHYEGVRTDKNVRDHEIYSVLPGAVEPPTVAGRSAGATPSGTFSIRRHEGALVTFLRDRTKVGIAAAVLLAVIALELVMILNRSDPASPAPVAKATPPAMPKETARPAEPAKAPETPKVEAAKAELAKPAWQPWRAPETTKPAPVPLAVETKPVPAESRPAPEKKPAPVETKAPEKKAPDPVRVIPPPRTPPAQIPRAATPAPSMQPTEPMPPVREEPKPAAPVVAQVVPVARAPLAFPPAALQRGIEHGTVRARLSIDAAGGVKSVTILSSDPPRIFDRAATSSLEEWKFNAGAESRTYDVEIEFKR